MNKDTLHKILILRFSSMGDVAIVASFLQEFCEQNPTISLMMVSKKQFQPFFENLTGVAFHALEAETKHKGIFGLWKLYKELKSYQPQAVADLHDNIRSHIISFFFLLNGIKICRIDKGRKEKKALTRTKNKILKPLRPTIERYADVFRNLGFTVSLKHKLHKRLQPLPENIKPLFAHNKKKIGVAPFAQFQPKVYNLNKMATVLKALNAQGYELLIFGGSEEEKQIAEKWEADFPNVHSLIKKCNLSEELAVISHLDVMLSMDSSGMHMASLMGVPVVSVWGATHPFAGFLGYGQSLGDCLQADVPARPNSIYGNKPCVYHGFSCIDLIEPTAIVKKIKEKINDSATA
jgi:ADP-heptose:LPS heptosyltransferase